MLLYRQECFSGKKTTHKVLFSVVFLPILVNLFYAVIIFISIYFGKIKWLLLLLLLLYETTSRTRVAYFPHHH